ncbi:hypothetical protein Tco_1306252 [Tanacetum coccineum]
MANQEQNPPQQEQPFVAAKQVGFNLEDILLNTNNEVAFLYPEHTNKETFKCVSDFISKCRLRELFTRSPNMYKEYLAEFWYSAKALENSKVSFSVPTGGIYGEVGVNTFRNAIGAYYLPHSSEYVAPPFIGIVRPWFKTIGYGETVLAKGTLKKSLLLPPRWSLVNEINIDYANIFWEDIIIKLNKIHREKFVPYTRFLSLLMMHKMKEGYRDGEVTPYPTQLSQWYLKLPSPLIMLRGFSKEQSLELNLDTRSIQLLQNNHLCPAKRQQKTSASTPVVTKMHKEDQQSALGYDASADSTIEANLGLSACNDYLPQQQGIDKGTKNTLFDHLFAGTDLHASSIARQVKEEEASRTIKLEDMTKLVSHVQPSFKDLDSPKDDPIIVVDDSDEDEEANKD